MFKHTRKITTYGLAAFLTVAVATSALAQEKLAINKDGIKVWTYQTANNPVMQYRAETILTTSIENAAGLILDTERGKRWIPYVADLKVIEQNPKLGKFIVYMRLDFPFPLNDRDVIVEGRLSKDKDGRIVFKNKSIIDARVPERKDIVRIKRYEGDWTFQKINTTQVKVTTSGYADPSGAIPLSFVNSFVQQQPYQMLQRMKQQIQQHPYTVEDLPELLR